MSFDFYGGFGFKPELQGKISGDIPFFKVSDINKDTIWIEFANNYIDYADLEKNQWKTIPKDALIIAKIGEALKKNHRKFTKVECLIDNNLLAIKLNNNLYLVEFIHYIFSIIDMSWYDNGSTIPAVNMNLFKNELIPLPPLPTQQAIVEYLDTKTNLISQFITDKQTMITRLKEQKQSLIHSAVTGKIPLLRGGNEVDGVDIIPKINNLNTRSNLQSTSPSHSSGTPQEENLFKPTNIPWLGDIPADWEVVKLKQVLTKLTDGSHISVKSLDEGKPYVTVTNINQKTGKIDLENCQKISDEEYLALVKNGCKPELGDILFSQIGTIGLTVEVKEDADFVMLSSLAILRTKQSLINSNYLIYLLLSDLIIQQYLLSMDGGAVKRITLKHISNFQIPLPQLEAQKAIVEYLDIETAKIDTLIDTIAQEIELTREYKQSLIYKAVTGKISVE